MSGVGGSGRPRRPSGSWSMQPSSLEGAGDLATLLRPPATPIRYFITDREGRRAPDPELFDAKAQATAQKLVDGKLPTTQMRRFFSPIVALRLQVEAGEITPDQLRAELGLLKARIVYAHKRSDTTVPAELVRLVVEHGASIRDHADFTVFARHVEAVVAYHTAFSRDSR